jgi:hypothetical protein
MGVSRPRSLQGRLWVIAILLGLLALIAQPAPGGAPYKGGTDAGASGHVSFTRTEFAATDVASRTHSPHGEAVVAVEVVVPVVPAKYDGSAIPSRHSSASATASAAMSLQFSETTGSSMPPVPLASETDATEATGGALDRVVIGKMADITADGALGPGERTLLDQLPDQGSAEANWAQNERVLLQEMQSGNPMRDASVDANGALRDNTGFLAMERGVLQREGWTYDPSTTLWSPGG